jgi:hypothetical protein
MTWFNTAQKRKGYKIVGFDGRRAYSLARTSDTVNINEGSVDVYGGQGLFLGTTPQFVKNYYTGLTDDQDLFLTYEYEESDLLGGDPNSNGEIKVRKAKLLRVEEL